MDFSTIIGIIAGFALIFSGIKAGGNIHNFIDYSAVMITIGGTFSALMINFPFKTLGETLTYMKKAVFPHQTSPETYIEMIVEVAHEARRKGLMALETKVDDYDDPFFRNGLALILDANGPDSVRSTLESKIIFQDERHKKGQAFFEKAAYYATGFGMLGTLIGLINMLRKAEDASGLGPHLAVALITTFYGALIANLICIPIAGKLKLRDDEERLCQQIMIEGMLAIQAGENPRRIQEKLFSYLPPGAGKDKSDRSHGERKMTNAGNTLAKPN